MKVKVIASVELKNIPDNYVIIDVPDEIPNKESYAENLVKEHLFNTNIAIKDSSHIIPKELINNIKTHACIIGNKN